MENSNVIPNNLGIEILTPTGFQKFDGLVQKESLTLKVVFTDGSFIRTTPDHQFLKSGENFVRAQNLKPKQKISGKQIVSIKLDSIDIVCDPINVHNGNVYIAGGVINHNCTFLGSANTLIDGAKLSKFPMMKPEQIFPEYCEYYPPSRDEKGNQNGNYIITVDTSRGADLDSSAFVVIDISVMPYKVVAKYKCSTVSTLMYPEVIHKVALRYNNAFVLIETNDLGQQVADILFYDLEYENVYMSYQDKLKEGGTGGTNKKPGLRTTKKTKSIGCSTLKILVESDHIELNDSDIIAELQHFVRVGASYKAEEGYHDDLVMCLVMFSYLTQEEVFKQLFDFSLRHEFIKKQMNEFEDQLEPIGFVDRGLPDEEVPTVQMGGDLWFEVNVGDPW